MNAETIDQKLDLILSELAEIKKDRESKKEMWDEFGPILKLALNSTSGQLQQWEELGYFKFIEGTGNILTEIMKNYTPNDLELLSRSIVGILDTVRSITQDDVMDLVSEAADAIHNADKTKPMGITAIIRSTSDDDVKRGIGMLVQLLRHIGKGVKQIKRSNMGVGKPRKLAIPIGPRGEKFSSMLAPKKEKKPVQPISPQVPVANNKFEIDGFAFDAEGFLVHPDEWSRELAEKIAALLGITSLSNAHWVIIESSRKESLETGSTPNMRRLCSISGKNAKEVFTLFPSSPAKTVAKIAGVRKPVGCI